MLKFFVVFLSVLLSMSLMVDGANAKRFGGGTSFGKQRSISQQAAPRPPAAPAAPTAAPGGNRWLGPVAGLVAGGLLASLFFGGAFDGVKPMDILLLMGLAWLAFVMLRAMRRSSVPRPMEYAGNTGAMVAAPAPGTGVASGIGQGRGDLPSWFEPEPFLRSAKSHFIRLQAAYDARDLRDIREYTTPEVYAEIALQVQEMSDKAQRTEVVTLNAELLDLVVEDGIALASVAFSGLIREEEHAAAEPFNEVWHVQKPAGQSREGWLVAGIQQV